MRFPLPKRMLTGAFVVAAVAAMPLAGMAQDPPAEADEARQAERARARAEERAERAQRAERTAREVYRAQAEQDAQVARTPRALVAPQIFGQQGNADVFQVRPAKVETEPQTYLGVSTRPLTADIAAHLNGEVPEGVGLIVTFLDDEGPAAKAGIKEHDVLLKIDDQWLINAPQLTVLIRMQKAGEEATLTLLRKGEEQEIEVELAEKELPVVVRELGQFGMAPLSAPAAPMPPVAGVEGVPLWRGQFELDGVQRDEVNRKVEEALRQLEGRLKEHNIPDVEQHLREVEQSLRNRHLDLERLQRDVFRPALMEQRLSRGGRVFINNDEMTLRMVNEDGEVTIEVADADGETVYEGPYPDKEELAELPKPAQEIIEQARRYLPAEEGQDEPRRRRGADRQPDRDADEDEDEGDDDDDDDDDDDEEQQDVRAERVKA